jgi:hypothetical protein
MSPRPDGPESDDRLSGALSGIPVPDHGPNFWADLTARLAAEGETTVLHRTESREIHPPPGSDILGAAETAPVSLDERRARRVARRGGRTGRSLGAAAAAVALVVAVAGAVTVIRLGDGTDSQVRTADRPRGAARPSPAAAPAAPAEFSATYDGLEGRDGPDGCCSTRRLTLARDGSFRWTSADSRDDMAYDAATGRHVELVTIGPGASRTRPNAYIATGVPAGGPDQRIAKPEPLGPIADFVVALARAGDSRVTTTTVAGRAAWHYDGPTAVDRLGGDGAPNHASADVDQASGVLLDLTRSVGDLVVTRFTASDVVVGDQIERSRYELSPPAGAKTQSFPIGFVFRPLDDAATLVPYDLLVPAVVPAGFTLDSVNSVAVNRDVASPTGAEGANPPTKPVVTMTWRRGATEFTVTLRPSGGEQWDDPLGAEGMVLDAQPVRLELPGRPPLEGQVAVDAPVRPHLWGITGDIVVTVSGDLSRADLEQVAGSLRPHRN